MAGFTRLRFSGMGRVNLEQFVVVFTLWHKHSEMHAGLHLHIDMYPEGTEFGKFLCFSRNPSSHAKEEIIHN